MEKEIWRAIKGYIFKFKNDKEILSKYRSIIGGKG